MKQNAKSENGTFALDPKLTRRELAAHLGVTERYVDLLVARRVIPIIRLSARCVRFNGRHVEEALAKLEAQSVQSA